MHMDVQQSLDTDKIQVHIIANGGPAKLVRFLVAEGQHAVFGYPAPTPTFRAGESRLIDTPLVGTDDKRAMGYIGCYDMTGAHFYVWSQGGDRRVYRMTGLLRHRERFSDDTLMKRFYPGFDINAVQLMRYETVDQSF
jgi:hypothetical protein